MGLDMRTFVEVPRDRLMSFAGEPWAYVVAHAEGSENGMRLVQAEYWNRNVMATPTFTPANGPVLPINCAWLREVAGRAFLYLQNW